MISLSIGVHHMSEESLFDELKRRKVFQVAAIYAAVAWGLTEVVVTIVEQLGLPDLIASVAVIAFVVGFPISVFLAWIFDITPEGIVRTPVTSRRGSLSIFLSILLLISVTAGLYYLISPAQKGSEDPEMGVPLIPSVAVLPFEIVSSNTDDAFLGSGISDELRDQLSRESGLLVSARSSSIAVFEKKLSAQEMSAKLGVAALVEGRVQRRDGALRISVQYVDGRTGLSDWSETYEIDDEQLVSTQQEIAIRVLGKIRPDIQIAVIYSDSFHHHRFALL
jgi:TolB-like protein